ncbi:MAG TPA: hypothetical protein PLA69_08770 [Flavobacterium sp.]|nr:hypothetical protein [Flavobacterium sp.]
MRKNLVALLLASAFLYSCADEEPVKALGSYDNGILVLNEGGFGTVTYISDDLQTVEQDIYTAVNGASAEMGQYTQNIFFSGDRAFIISGGSNKITVVNRYTFEHLHTIETGLSNPRYGVAFNGKAYVTNSADFMTTADDYVAVIDLEMLEVEDPIAINDAAERIIEDDGKLYVTNGSFGSGSNITVINPSTKQVETTVAVGTAPNSLEEEDGILYVLCSSFSEPSRLVKVNPVTNTVISTIEMPASMSDAKNLDIEDGHVYFSVGAKVYKVPLNATAITDTPLFDTGSASAYIGYGFAVKDNRVYISEAREDFVSDGKVFIYSTSGAFIDEIPAGLGPNGFYFN